MNLLMSSTVLIQTSRIIQVFEFLTFDISHKTGNFSLFFRTLFNILAHDILHTFRTNIFDILTYDFLLKPPQSDTGLFFL